jgi:putative phosphoesterase
VAKLLIISDVHSNPAALSRLAEGADTTVFLGDVVDYGPLPAECVEMIKQRAHILVKGNHDAAVAEGYHCGFYQGVPEEIRDLNRQRLSEEALSFLAGLPVRQQFEFGGARFLALHASVWDPLSGYMFPFTDSWLWRRQVALVDADFLLLGHTHWPMTRQFGKVTVINPGSVGQPRDGDPRGSYAVWQDGAVTIKRFEYPVEKTVEALQSTGLHPETVGLLCEILRNGG